MNANEDVAFLRQAIELATASVMVGGGPFGAVVVCNGEVIGRGQNSVVRDSDPSAHAEVNAIRAAARALGRPHLDDCTLYTSCEPCPMCLATSLWARIPRIVYAATHGEATRAGFSDTHIAMALYGDPLPARCNRLEHMDLPEAGAPFQAWQDKADKIPY
ncbi:MAG: nucleoside deaminase [Halothiobacillaceae bacterium]|nr:MAG: nucleoside deaminase [Halothiobacillaceae bacterium]